MSSTVINRYDKDPAATLDYSIDWRDLDDEGPWLADDEDLVSATWTVPEDSGLVVDSEPHDTGKAIVWLSGGTLSGTTYYRVVCHVVTTEGRIDDRSIYIRVTDR